MEHNSGLCKLAALLKFQLEFSEYVSGCILLVVYIHSMVFLVVMVANT